MYIEELSETRAQELEIIFEKEINDYQNKIICREKFIYLIKDRCKLMEFCYLYKKYIGEIKVIGRLVPNISLSEWDDLIETGYEDNKSINTKNYSNKSIKKLVKIEKMSSKIIDMKHINERRM